MELLVGSFFLYQVGSVLSKWLLVVSLCTQVVEVVGMNGALSLVIWFLGPVFTQKTGPALAFYFSSSNKNSGKTFAVL